MNRKFSFVLVFSLVLSFVVSSKAQTNPSNQSSASKQSNADKDKRLVDRRLEAERRATATSLLLDVAEESAKFKDLFLRARVQARAADVLWDADQERARSLFRKAWDAASTADKENARRIREEVKAAMKERGSYAYQQSSRVSEEVLRLAAKRDRSLGEELLKKLDEDKKEEAENAANEADDKQEDFLENPNDPYTLTSSQKQRINLALSLLEANDVERAIQFADPALVRISMEGLNFLCTLRLKNASLADARYSASLSRAAADFTSDANAVSLLSSYIFTPFQFVRYGQGNSVNSSNFGQEQTAPFDNQGLIQNFLRLAEQVLLRPTLPQEQVKQTTGAWGKFKTIQRLLPYFERYSTAETVTALKAQMATLRPGSQAETQPDSEDVFFPRGKGSEDEGKDFVQRALDRASQVKTQEERDQIYVGAAISAVHRNDARARSLVDKIEDSETRSKVRAFVDFIFISNALRDLREQKKDDSKSDNKQKPKEQAASGEKKKSITIDETLQMIRGGEITNFQRVWALTEVARSIAKTDKQQAVDLLEETLNEANRISQSNAERPQAFVGIASLLFEINRSRAWEIVSDALRAANSCEDYKGEDAVLMVRVMTKGMASVTSQSLETYNLTSLFKVLAQDDLGRSIAQARSFTGESPRSTAIITIARTILEKKK
jgi:hypothetical protein